jgi:hypothetical protein
MSFDLLRKFHSVAVAVVERLWALDDAASSKSGVGRLWMTWLQSSWADLMSAAMDKGGFGCHGQIWHRLASVTGGLVVSSASTIILALKGLGHAHETTYWGPFGR